MILQTVSLIRIDDNGLEILLCFISYYQRFCLHTWTINKFITNQMIKYRLPWLTYPFVCLVFTCWLYQTLYSTMQIRCSIFISIKIIHAEKSISLMGQDDWWNYRELSVELQLNAKKLSCVHWSENSNANWDKEYCFKMMIRYKEIIKYFE